MNNTTISLKYDSDEATTLPTPSYVGSQCTFTGWTGSNGETPQLQVTIPVGNTEDKTYTANFNCS